MFLRLCIAATLCRFDCSSTRVAFARRTRLWQSALQAAAIAPGLPMTIASTRMPVRTPADSPTEALAHPVAPILLHARQAVIPASPVATAGATSLLVEDHTTHLPKRKL